MFTPLPSLVGGCLLSYSTSTLLLSQGRVLGCSGVSHATVAGVVLPETPNNNFSHAWKWSATAGLLVGGLILRVLRPNLEAWVGASIFDDQPLLRIADVGLAKVLLAGVLVGAGTKLANGCTSGHMLVGLARQSKRSLVAVLTFFSAALVTATQFAPLPPAILAAQSSAAIAKPYTVDLYDAAPPLLASAILLAPVLSSLPGVTYSLPVPKRFKPAAQSFLLGITFSLGLAFAGMTRPSKVLGFFYLPGLAPAGAPQWDPSLMMVALGGLIPNWFAWNKVANVWKKPIVADKWECPSTTAPVDAKLVLGSLMFGVGWGMMGICPGPLLAVLGAGPAIAGSALFAFAGAYACGGLLARPF
ncbi:hypothetical protein JCM8202_005021 [Rhodotorula sphaerocarpa]